MGESAAATVGTLHTGRSYSSLIWKGMTVFALVLALLPIPVAALDLLPAYHAQARFLVFYAPIVCLLTLAYLFYVRDTLARLMFAALLDPLVPLDPYYRPLMRERFFRFLVQLRSAIMAALPALLLGASFYCTFRYTNLLNESVAIAGEPALPPGGTGEELGYVAQAPPESASSLAAKGADSSTARAHAVARPTDPVAARARILRTARIDDIPFFAKLTALFIGIFIAPLAALTIMALKEYAKEAMGLSEEELVLGPRTAEDT